MTTNQIIPVINCTSRTVHNILRLYCETNNVIEREGCHRSLSNNRKRIQNNIIMSRAIQNFMRLNGTV